MPNTSVLLPLGTLERAQALLDRVNDDLDITGLLGRQATRSSVIRLAVVQGLRMISESTLDPWVRHMLEAPSETTTVRFADGTMRRVQELVPVVLHRVPALVSHSRISRRTVLGLAVLAGLDELEGRYGIQSGTRQHSQALEEPVGTVA